MLEIKNWMSGEIIHTYGAGSLAGADLSGLDLRYANLTEAK